ncbi:MAG: DUF1801 domain-containing protein [Polyangiales bacterium]
METADYLAYLASLPEKRRLEVTRLHELITKTVPDYRVQVGSGMIGYGKYRYRYESGLLGRERGESFRIGLASRAAGISIYVNAADAKGYLPESHAAQLGKVDVGKSCIRIKKADDLDVTAFVALLKKAASMRAPGEIA